MPQKLSFFQKLKLCWIYPFFYLLIVTSVNLFTHFHSNYVADKINADVPSGYNHMKRSTSIYNFERWFKFQYYFFIKDTVFLKSWTKENLRLLRSIFMFNEMTEFYVRSYNRVYSVDDIVLFDFLKNIGESTMESSWAPIYQPFLGKNIFLYTPLYSFIIFISLFSVMIRRWQFLTFLEKDEQ